MNEGDERSRYVSLESYFLSVNSPLYLEQKFHYFKYFRYCSDVLMLSKQNKHIAFILWISSFMLIDFVFCSISIPFLWNNETVVRYVENYVNDLFLQQISFVFSFIFLSFVFLQWISIFVYDSSNRMGTSRARFLYFSYIYLPQFASIITGILFGYFLKQSSSTTDGFQAIALYSSPLIISYFLLYLSNSSFQSTTAYNISPSKGPFAHFVCPMKPSDVFMIFLVSVFLPFRNSSKEFFSLVSSFTSFFWGLKNILGPSQPWVRRLGMYLGVKLSIDSIVFGLYSMISIWFSIDTHVLMIVWGGMYFLNFLLTLLLISYIYSGLKDAFVQTPEGRIFDPKKLSRPQYVHFVFRLGISAKLEACIQPAFLQFMLAERFFAPMIPDIVKVCLIRGIPLNTIFFDPKKLGRKELMRMKFLAMQVHFFNQSQIIEDSPEVHKVISFINNEISSIEQFTDSFWTERDQSHSTIIDLATRVKKTTNVLKEQAINYFESPSVQQIWRQYTERTLCETRKIAVSISNEFSEFFHDPENPFGFNIARKKTYLPHSVSEAEQINKFLNSDVRGIAYSFKITVYISLIILLFFMVYSNIVFLVILNDKIKIVSDSRDIMMSGISLSYSLLKDTDKLISMPDVTLIISILNVSYDNGMALRNKIRFTDDHIANFSQYITKLENISIITPFTCPKVFISFITSSIGFFEAHSSIRLCNSLSIIEYLNMIYYQFSIKNSEILPYRGSFVKNHVIYLFILIILISLVPVFLIFRIKSKANKLLSVVRYITAVKTQKSESNEPDFSFSSSFLCFIWLLIVISSLSYSYIFFTQFQILDDEISQLNIQFGSICQIVSRSFLTFSLIEQTIIDQGSFITLEGYISNQCDSIVEHVQAISTIGLSDFFKTIPPLDNWFSKNISSISTLILDYANLLRQKGDFILESFSFLMSRYILMNNISQMASKASVEVSKMIISQANNNSASLWMWTMLFVMIMGEVLVFIYYTINRQSLWTKGVVYLLQREMSVSSTRAKNIIQMISTTDLSLIDIIPYPCFVLNGDIVIDCNDMASNLSPYTNNQMIGQSIRSILGTISPHMLCRINGNEIIIKTHENWFGDNLRLVIAYDTSQVSREEQYIKYLTTFYNNPIEIPIRDDFVIVTMFFSIPFEKHQMVADFITDTEKKYPFLSRITISSTYYKAISSMKKAIITIGFVFDVMKEMGFMICCSITHGNCTILRMNSINVISGVLGTASMRGTWLCMSQRTNTIFIDYDLYEIINGIITPQHISVFPVCSIFPQSTIEKS